MTRMTRIIAECGLNFGGSLDKAVALANAALDAGADYIKFQFLTDPYRTARSRSMCPEVAEVWARTIPRMDIVEWRTLMDHIPRERRMLSVFAPIDVIRATGLQVDALKVGHLEAQTALPKLARQYARTLFVTGSTGIVCEGWMRCVPKYPCTLAEATSLIDDLPQVGYSDHTGPDLDAARYALARHRSHPLDQPGGIQAIEVHVHLDGCKGCTDHAVSKSMTQLAILCAEAHA